MSNMSLTALSREQLELAKAASSGRSARTVYGGQEHILRQTMIALTAGSQLGEHASPGEGTVQVLHGRVRLTTGEASWDGASGHLIAVPAASHSLAALEDSVILLTVVTDGLRPPAH
jgi:quercetin dioxygenase-like cupin family protein